MIIPLLDEHREKYAQMEMHKVWIDGEEKKWPDTLPLSDFPIGFIKGDYGSQIENDHTSIKFDQFEDFAITCVGKVFIGTGRIVFEREVVIAFTDEADAVRFMLIWG